MNRKPPAIPVASERSGRAAADALTDPGHWDRYWEQARSLPIATEPGDQPSTTAILDVLDRYTASAAPLSVLEVGGAPGGYLVHLWRRFGHDVCVLDNSPVGIELTRRNFEMLGVPGRALDRDLFSTEQPVEQFDVVYSLGLVEHFADTTAVVAAHLAYVRPGGRLIVGCPNLLGINGALLRYLSPSALEWHDLDVMDLRGWSRFERALGLRRRYVGYIAGFQPAAFWRCERRTIRHRLVARGLAVLARRWKGPLGRAISRPNSRRWSYYAIGVYDKPSEEHDRPVTDQTTDPAFDPDRYWEDRLSERYTLGATGWSGLGEGFNRWSYRVRRVVFHRAVRPQLDNPSAMRVLDVGSGTGFYLEAWRRLGVADVAGSDLTSAAVQRLSDRFAGMPIHKLDIGDAQIDVPGAPFDAVSIMDVLYHIVDDARYGQALENLAGLLKPGGLLVLSENFVAERQPGRHQVSRSGEVIEGALARAGLDVIARHPVFFLMNSPVASVSRPLHAWWRTVTKVAPRNEALSWSVGAALYPVDLSLALTRRDGPSTKLVICRRL